MPSEAKNRFRERKVKRCYVVYISDLQSSWPRYNTKNIAKKKSENPTFRKTFQLKEC